MPSILGRYGVPVVTETIADTAADAVAAASEMGFPAVLKGIGDGLLHKTEGGLVHLNLADEKSVRSPPSKSFKPPPGHSFSFSLKFTGTGSSWPAFSVTLILVRRFFSDWAVS
jgi:hypothetical protein